MQKMGSSNHNVTQAILSWYHQNGRSHLPWRKKISAYRVWIAEIMLQQTQVATVIPYFQRFMQTYPTLKKLANAPLPDILHLWSGLGYYTRARCLYQTAQIIANDYHCEFPNDRQALERLPGIGRSTAAAIAAIAFNKPETILDGNVKRILMRVHALEGNVYDRKVIEQLWSLAEQYTPKQNCDDYTQAIMDLGATLCTPKNPQCTQCPIPKYCRAFKSNSVDQYPAAKPRTVIPKRECIWLVIMNKKGQILLKQQKDTGIWAQLWCLPECTAKDNIKAWLKTHLNLTVGPVKHLAAFSHRFTHLQLNITPIIILTTQTRIVKQNDWKLIWYQSEQQKLAMPTPVKRLLTHTLQNTTSQS